MTNKGRAKHISWNLLSGVVSGLLTVVATGVMVRSLGYERFGVVSIWIMLQGLVQLFDFGVGASLNRELTKTDSSDNSIVGSAIKFYRINGAFWAAVGASVLIPFYGWSSAGPYVLMVVALAIQFQTLPCTSILMANVRYDDLAKSQIFSNALRFGGGIVIVSFTDSLSVFFLYQVVAAWVGLYLFARYSKRYTDNARLPEIVECVRSLSRMGRQSLGMWLTSLVSIGISSADRTLVGVMEGSVNLGKFSASLTAASLLSLVTLPFYRVYFTEYSSTYFNNRGKLLGVFGDSCQQLAILVTFLGTVAYFGAEPFFYIWLGAYDVQQTLTFKLLLVGMGFASLTWLPGALCQAAGKPSIHLWVMAISFVISIFVAIPCIERWGYPGASAIWWIHGIVGIVMEPYLIKRYVLPISLVSWYRRVFFIPSLVVGLLCIWIWNYG